MLCADVQLVSSIGKLAAVAEIKSKGDSGGLRGVLNGEHLQSGRQNAS